MGYNDGNISNSYTMGTVTIHNIGYAIGGFAGMNYGDISNSYSTDTVTTNGMVGGITPGAFLGESGGGLLLNDYWDTEILGLTIDRGHATGLTTAQMMTQASFNGWDFTNIWSIDEGHDYPKLRNAGLGGGDNTGGMIDPGPASTSGGGNSGGSGTNPGTGTGGSGTGDNSGGNTGGSGTNPGTGTGGTGSGTGSGTSGGTDSGNNESNWSRFWAWVSGASQTPQDTLDKSTSSTKSDPSSALDQKTTTKTKSATNKSTTTTPEIDHITFDGFGGLTYVSPTINISKLTGEEIDTLTNNFMSNIKNDIFSKGLTFMLAHGLPNLVQDAMDDTIQELLTLVPGVKALQDEMNLLDGLNKPIDVSHDLSNVIYNDHFNINSINTPQGPFPNADGTQSTYYVTVYPMQQTPPTYGVAIVEITEKKGFWPWDPPWIPTTMTISTGYEVREETFN